MVGTSYVLLRREEGWGLEIYMPLTWLCWLSKGGKSKKKKKMNSFFYKVFRGKYFQNGDFLYANLGHSERCIITWHDKWIPIHI